MMRAGQKQTIHLNGTDIQATVAKVAELDRDRLLVWYEIPAYGLTQPYLVGKKDYADEIEERSGIPAMYKGKGPKEFDWTLYEDNDVTAIRDIVNGFCGRYERFRDDGRGLYIFGKIRGSGKTLLACSLANWVIARFGSITKFVNAAALTEMARRKEDLTQYYDCELLVLDDIGAQEDKEWINSMIYSLIDHRYNRNKCTIFTSNRSWDSTHPDDRIHSRIYGMSVPVHLPEVPVRQKIADERTKEFLDHVFDNAS